MYRIRGHIRLCQELAQQHTVRHVLDDGAVRGAILETDAIPNLVPELHAHLFGYLAKKNRLSGLFAYESGMEVKSKMGHEMDQTLTGFDDFGVVEELRFRALQRHKNHQNPLIFDSLH